MTTRVEADEAIELAPVQVIDVTAIGTIDGPVRDAACDESVEKGPHVLAVANASTDFVLAPQAIAAVQRDRREEPRLPR